MMAINRINILSPGVATLLVVVLLCPTGAFSPPAFRNPAILTVNVNRVAPPSSSPTTTNSITVKPWMTPLLPRGIPVLTAYINYHGDLESDEDDENDNDDDDDDLAPEVDVSKFRAKPSISYGLNRGRSPPSQRKAIGTSSTSSARSSSRSS